METTTPESPSKSKSAAARGSMSYGRESEVLASQVQLLRSELRDHSQDMAQISVGLVHERQKLIGISASTTDALQKSQRSYQETLTSLNAQQRALLDERLAVLNKAVDVVKAGQSQMERTLDQAKVILSRMEVAAAEVQTGARNMTELYQRYQTIPLWMAFGLGIAVASLCLWLWIKFTSGAR